MSEKMKQDNTDDNSLLFFEDSEEELHYPASDLPPWNVLIVDDEKEVHDVTRFVLQDYTFDQRPLNLICTYSAEEAKEVMSKTSDIALAIIDVVMETEHAGLDLIKYIRKDLDNNVVNIILRTGQPGQAPEREIIATYEINDYKSKNELTAQKLFSTVTASLRNYRNLVLLEKNRQHIEEKNHVNQLLLDTLPGIAMLIKTDGTIIGINNCAQEYGFTLSHNCFNTDSSKFPLRTEYINMSVTWEESYENKVYNARWITLQHDLLLFCAIDVTDLKQKEEEKRQMEKQFLESQKMKSIGVLASGIAHDFNNILAAIRGYSDLLLFSLSKEGDDYSYAEKISKATKNGVSLAKKLYFLARKESDNFDEINLNEALEDVKALLLPNCKKIRIQLDLQANPSQIMGEKNQIQNAFLNLGVNARDAMPDGGEIAIKTSKQSYTEPSQDGYSEDIKPGDYIQITVSDSGTGIPEDIRTQIFEPLFTTKKAGDGTGLGLAAVLSCIKNHKGYIKVESSINEGTCFTVLLPLKVNNVQ